MQICLPYAENKNKSTGNSRQTGFLIVVALMAISLLCSLSPAFAGGLVNGGYVTGNILTAEETDSYTFSVDVGQTVLIRMAATGGLIPSMRLYNPSGDAAISTWISGDPVAGLEYQAGETGTYTLKVCDKNLSGTGSYKIYFAHMPDANEHGALTNDGIHDEQIDLGDIDTYTFTAEAGQIVLVRMAKTNETDSLHPAIRLYNPSGGAAISTWITGAPVTGIEYQAAESGTYTLAVCDKSFSGTGSYKIYFAHMPDSNELEALTNDGIHDEQIDLGDIDTYTFTAEAGQIVLIRMVDTSEAGSLHPAIRLYNPSGGAAISTWITGDPVTGLEYQAAESGTYTLAVCDKSFTGTGSYKIYFAHMPDSNELKTLTNDGIHNEQIDPGDIDTYTFTAEAGQMVLFRMAKTNETDSLRPAMRLYNPSGGAAISTWKTGDQVTGFEYQVEESGTYTLAVCDKDMTGTGSYKIYFAHMPDSNELETLTNDGIHNEQIDLGDIDTYTFTAEAGQMVLFRMAKTNEADSLHPAMRLYTPSGSAAISTWKTSAPVTGFEYQVEESGTYTLAVCDKSLTGTGAYKIYFAHMPDANEHGALTNNDVYDQQIDLGDIDTYTFAAKAGERVVLTVADTSETGDLIPSIQLYNPSGGAVFSTSKRFDIAIGFEYEVEESGTYTLAVYDGYLNRTGSYRIHFAHIPGANEHGLLSDSDSRTETIDIGDLDTYTFMADTDDSIEIDVTTAIDGSLYPRFALYDRFGTYLTSAYANSGVMSYTIPSGSGGLYTILIFGRYYYNVGDYALTYTRTGGPVDIDGDGIPNSWESDNGLDPDNSDDGAEDTDADGLTNLEEYQNNTDPQSWDSDGDYMPDGWEIDNALLPLEDDAFDDADLDGYCNFREYLSGSDPNEINNIPPIFADIPYDGDVDGKDVSEMIGDFSESEYSDGSPFSFDLDNDGDVDDVDIRLFSEDFGRVGN